MKPLRCLALCGLLLLAGCTTDTTEPVFDNPYDLTFDPSISSPEALGALVGSNLVRLTWRMPEGEVATTYVVFRAQINDSGAEIEAMHRIASATGLTYDDGQVRDGRLYRYAISAGVGGRYSPPGSVVEARPASFGIALEAGAQATRNQEVQVAFSVPTGTSAVLLSEREDLAGAEWRPITLVSRWALSTGDGTKTVHARFRLDGGAESLPVSDDIQLDTRAVIASVEFDGAEVRAPGQTIRFRVDTSESGGTVRLTVTNLVTDLALLDDGTADATPGDGIYERTITLPSGVSIDRAPVRASFTDAAGNQAAPLESARRLTVQAPPAAVELLSPETTLPPDAAAVRLQWTASRESDFSAYRVLRTEGATTRRLGVITSAPSVTFTDDTAAEGAAYSYAVEVVNAAGLATSSNVVTLTVPNLRPPAAVTLTAPTVSSTTRLALGWGRSQDRDFAAYRVYRNSAGAVTDEDPLLAEITDIDRPFLDDDGLTENTAYHYRVYVVDRGGLTTRSNEVSGRTKNEAPPAVTLNLATEVDTGAVTLRWTSSEAHDFAVYRIYRSEGSGVNPASFLAAEIDNPAITTFRDTGLRAGVTYHYRVYVVDDGTDPGPRSTGSNEITVTTASR